MSEADDKQQPAPRSVRLYPPVETRVSEREEMLGKRFNFNYWTNLLWAQMFGLNDSHIEEYKRKKGE